MQDKVRLYFTHKGILYEKWFDVPESAGNEEQKAAFIRQWGLNILAEWYKEVTGLSIGGQSIEVAEFRGKDPMKTMAEYKNRENN